MAGDDGKTEGRTYDAQDITVLEGLEAVRKRPGMYIGSTGVRGLHHLVWEVVDNSVDEALAGHATPGRRHRPPGQLGHRRSTTAAASRSRCTEKEKKPGGRGRPHRPARRRQVRRRRRLQGLGRPARRRRLGRQRAVRARSRSRSAATASCIARRTSAARRRAPLEKGEATKETGHDDHVPARRRDLRGHRVRLPDARDAPARDRVPDARPAHHAQRRARRGQARPSSSTTAASRTSSPTSTPTRSRSAGKVIYFEGESDEGQVEIAMQWNPTYQESIHSFANNINTHEGGSHLCGFRSALTTAVNRYAKARQILKEKDDNLSGEDVREGLTAVISAKLADPQFEGQTKTKLGNPGMEGFVRSVVYEKLNEFLEENPKDADGDRAQGRPGVTGARGRAQGARSDAPQVRAGEHGAAGQAARLPGQGPGAGRDLHRRGRLRRRLGDAGPRPRDAGRPPAARQDPQRREEPDRQGPAEQRDPGAHHRARHRRSATSSRSRTRATTRSSS